MDSAGELFFAALHVVEICHFVANYDRQHRIDVLDLYAGKAAPGSACLVYSVHVHVGVGCVFSGASFLAFAVQNLGHQQNGREAWVRDGGL